MVEETSKKVRKIITELYQKKHIDEMTFKWLSRTPNPPRIPVFYTLTKTHKVNLSSRPIISGCDSPTERISAFVDSLLQPIMKEQQSYIKDTTSLKEREFHKMQSLSQWMLQAYIQIHV